MELGVVVKTRAARPGTDESALVRWFRRASRPRSAYSLLAFAAVGYSLGVALPLALAGAKAMPDPFLRISAGSYFFWGTYFYAPVIAAAWMLASAAMYIVASAFQRTPDFGDLLRYTAFATGIGTMGTLLSDLVTSPMRALGIINEQAWEQSVASQGGWWLFLSAFMAVYLVLFCVAYPIAVRVATQLSWSRAIITGIAGFLVFQAFEFVFIR